MAGAAPAVAGLVMRLAVNAVSAMWLAAAAGGGMRMALGDLASAGSTTTVWADGAVAGMRLVAAAEAGAGPGDAGSVDGRLTGLGVNPERQAITGGFESPMLRRSGGRPHATGATHAMELPI